MCSLSKYITVFVLAMASAQTLDDRYHTYDEIIDLVDSLSSIELYQDWFMVDTVGYSNQENIPILAVKISDNVQTKEDEPRALFIGQVHAEEILGIEIVLDLMMNLLDPRPEDFNHMNILKSSIKDKEINTVMSNSFGFGGTNASLVFSTENL